MKRAILWERRALKDLAAVTWEAKERIVSALERLATSGEGDVRRLKDVRPATFRLRVGDRRVLFRHLQGEETFLILRILPRDQAYR